MSDLSAENEKFRKNIASSSSFREAADEDEDILDCNPIKKELNRSVIGMKETSLEFEFESNVKNNEQLPLQFHSHDTSAFGWNFGINEDDEASQPPPPPPNGDDELQPKKIMKGISELSTKIDNIRNLQQKSFDIVHKVHSEHDDMQKTLKLNLSQLNLQQNTVNSSYSNLNNFEGANGINAKIDALSNYLKTLKMDQRLVAVYKKIDAKLEKMKNSMHSDSESSNKVSQQLTEDLEKTLISFQHQQESQQSAIDCALNQIIEHMADWRAASKKEQQNNKSKSPVVDISLSPISNKNGGGCNESFDAQSNLLLHAIQSKQQQLQKNEINLDQMIDSQSNRLNELMMNEFVLILTNNLSVASDESFNKLIGVILKIINYLVELQWKAIQSKLLFCSNSSSVNVSDKIETALMRYKAEIDDLFNNLFQSTINNVIRDLIHDRMQRIRVQSKICKLTNKLQSNKQNNNTKKLTLSQNNKIKQQIQKISVQRIFMPLIGLSVFVLFIGVFIGYMLLSTSIQNLSCHHRGHSFM